MIVLSSVLFSCTAVLQVQPETTDQDAHGIYATLYCHLGMPHLLQVEVQVWTGY